MVCACLCCVQHGVWVLARPRREYLHALLNAEITIIEPACAYASLFNVMLARACAMCWSEPPLPPNPAHAGRGVTPSPDDGAQRLL